MTEQKRSKDMLDQVGSETQEEVHPLLQTILDHIKLIGIVVGSLLLAVAGYSGFTYYQESRMEEARQELGTILAQQQGEERIESLQSFLAQWDRLETEARLELARAQMAQGLYEESVSTWAGLAEEAEGQLEVLARLGQATSLTMSGKPSEAVSLLKELRENAAEPYADNINTSLAEAAEQAGAWETALEAYERLKSSATDQASTEYLEYKIQRIKEKIG